MKYQQNEHLIIPLIDRGVIVIHDDWTIWRHKKKVKNEDKYISVKKRNIEREFNGYKTIHIRIDNVVYGMFSHRIIWSYLKGKIIDNLTINHKNGNKLDNNIDNLEVMTIKDNIRHAVKNGLRADVRGNKNPMYGKSMSQQKKINMSLKFIANKTNCGEKNGQSKIKDKDRKVIRKKYASGITCSELSKNYNVSRSTIYRIAGVIKDYRSIKRKNKHELIAISIRGEHEAIDTDARQTRGCPSGSPRKAATGRDIHG